MHEHIEVEQQLISILLSSKEAVKDWLVSPVRPAYFDETHEFLLSAIIWANSNDVLLTRNSFKEYLSSFKKLTSNETASQVSLYNKCLIKCAKPDDLPMLIGKVKEAYVARKTAQYLNEYNKESKRDGTLAANASLAQKLGGLESDTEATSTLWIDIGDSKTRFMESLYERKNNPASRLTCGIPEIDETMNVGFKKGHLTMFCADVGSYKCGWENELCQISTGEYITFGDIYRRVRSGEEVSLLSLNEETGKIYVQPIQAVSDNGVKEVFKVITRSGFSVHLTGNHPLLKLDGWKRTDEIQAGDRVAISRIGVFGDETPPEGEATWVGCMISDGGASQPSYTFSNIDIDILKPFFVACGTVGLDCRPRDRTHLADYRLTGSPRNLGRKYGLDGNLSIHKFISSEIYRWDRASLRELLRAMYGCDGSFAVNKKITRTGTKMRHQVMYCTSSKRLATDVQNLLLKFGLVGRIFTFMSEYKRTDGTMHRREAYRVYISDAQQVSKFIRDIGFLGEKQARAEACLPFLDGISESENPNIDLIPSEIWPLLKRKFKDGKTKYGCRRYMKGEAATRENVGHCGNNGKGVPRGLLRKIAGYLNDDDELLRIADADLYWDEVVSIESIGEQQTYDISMPVHHNFVANNFVTHNTTIMLNVALNVWKRSGENVLYVPLEMPGDEILQKCVSRETEIPFNLIEHAESLNDQQIAMIAEEFDKWTNPTHRFQILDMNGRTKLSEVRREIEKKIMAGFCPRVVVIDYADNLTPERRNNRSDLEMNDILEDMRQMGKQLGFAVITAGQLARDGLKRVREQKDGKQQLGSTDIRGGQVMMANSDTVYAQLRNPSQPADQLIFFCLKARHGKNIFKNNQDRTILSVRADIGLIESANDVVYEGVQDDDLLDGIVNPPRIGVPEVDEDDPF